MAARTVALRRLVTAEDDPRDTGDEAVVHARRRAYLVVIGADRVEASERAVAEGAQVIVCDDGLQHARLARDYEIAVVDGERGLGNRLVAARGTAAGARVTPRSGERRDFHES